jgi:hypothetical protein
MDRHKALATTSNVCIVIMGLSIVWQLIVTYALDSYHRSPLVGIISSTALIVLIVCKLIEFRQKKKQ